MTTTGLEWLLAASRDPMLVCDADGVIVRANAPLASLFGWPLEELIGEPVEVVVPATGRARHAAMRRAMGQDTARAMGAASFNAIDQGGQEIPVEVSLSPVVGPDGLHLTVATVHDQRPRIAANLALRESEARMRAVFETVVDGIITIDERGVIERVNPAAEDMFGYPEAEIAGRNISMLMPSPDRERHDGYLRNYLVTGQKRILSKGREVHGLRKDGSIFPLELAVTEMRIGERGTNDWGNAGKNHVVGSDPGIRIAAAVVGYVLRCYPHPRRFAPHGLPPCVTSRLLWDAIGRVGLDNGECVGPGGGGIHAYVALASGVYRFDPPSMGLQPGRARTSVASCRCSAACRQRR